MPKAETLRTQRLVASAVRILDVERPMTVRQLFYRLVSVNELENAQAAYVRLSRVMTIAREDGRCDWSAIVDRSRPEYAPSVWSDAAAYAETIQRSYRRDFWDTQPAHVEVWAEKDAVIGSIQELTNELGVTVRVGRGFMSTTRVHEIAEHFDEIAKPIRVYYLGDHDPSGRAIEEDLQTRVDLQLMKERSKREAIRVRRLAIHAEDIAKFRLPPLRVKTSDSRVVDFVAKHGLQCVELDALPPNELRNRIRKAVMQHVDRVAWKRAKTVQAAEKQSIVRFAETLRRLAT